jgi:type III restriction enzyme
VKRGLGEPKPLHVVEIKGIAGENVGAKNDGMFSHWLPAVNNQGGFGRWAFVVVKDIHDAKQQAPRAA